MDHGLMSSIWTSVRPLTQQPTTSFSSNRKEMDLKGRLTDNDLAAGFNSESGDQWLHVWMEVSGAPQRLVLGLILFHIFINDISS